MILNIIEYVWISLSCASCLQPPIIGSIEHIKSHRVCRPAKHTIVFNCTILQQNVAAIRLICISSHARLPVPLAMRQASFKSDCNVDFFACTISVIPGGIHQTHHHHGGSCTYIYITPAAVMSTPRTTTMPN